VVDGSLSYDSKYLTLRTVNWLAIIVLSLMTLLSVSQIQITKVRYYQMKLLTSLLEDKDGVIDLNLSIRGNVDNPEFEIGKLLWDAFFKIVGNVVKSSIYCDWQINWNRKFKRSLLSVRIKFVATFGNIEA
jgi:hypothetical protein